MWSAGVGGRRKQVAGQAGVRPNVVPRWQKHTKTKAQCDGFKAMAPGLTARGRTALWVLVATLEVAPPSQGGIRVYDHCLQAA